MSLIDFPSVMMTIGGSYFALVLNTRSRRRIQLFSIIGRAFRIPNFGEMQTVEGLLSFSEKARREGLLSLEEDVETIENAFMKRGLQMVVDSVDPEVIRTILETELSQMNERHGKWLKMIDQWAKLAPGMGMLGTVSGLIGMLKNLDGQEPHRPQHGRGPHHHLLRRHHGQLHLHAPHGQAGVQDAAETKVREMIIEGVLSIQQGDNPHILQMKLSSYLSPGQQRQLAETHPAG